MIRSAWLIDATVYQKNIDKSLLALRNKFYLLKNYAKNKKFGIHPVPTQNAFSLGLLRIATLLENNSISARYIHSDDLVEILDKENPFNLPDVVIFSAVTPTIEWCSEMSSRVKQINSKVEVVIGGAHVNAAFESTRKRNFRFDRIIKGYDINAVETLLGIKIQRPLKFVNYDLLPKGLMQYDINLFTTLGCVNNCSYCSDSKIPYFMNSNDGDLSEIIRIVGGSKNVHYFDSTLGGGIERAGAVLEKIKQVNHSCHISCDFRADLVNTSIVMKLASAGFKEIMFGVETIDRKVLLYNNRRISIEVILKALRMVRDYSDMYISIYTLAGLPGTNETTSAKDIEFYSYLYKENLVDEIKNSLFVPYPIDNVNWEEKGLIIENAKWSDYDRQSFPVYSGSLTSEQIWDQYLKITKSIVDNWESALKCNINKATPYPEYYLKCYSS